MAKAKQATPEKAFMLTQDQFNVLIEVRSLLDNSSDTLGEIDGDGNLFEIGRSVGDACGDIINAFNKLGDLVDSINPDANDNEWEFDIK
jgi:hypothetical protein